MRRPSWRNPYPPRQLEREYESALTDYFLSRPEIKVVSRQVRIPGAGIADICLYTEFENDIEPDGVSRIITVVEVKAGKADRKALAQLTRYISGLQVYWSEVVNEVVWFGILAAPRFTPEIVDLANRYHPELSLMEIRP